MNRSNKKAQNHSSFSRTSSKAASVFRTCTCKKSIKRVTLCLSFQFIKLDFNLIFGVVPVEELTRMLLKPFVLFWCKWVRQLKHQVTLSRMHLWSATDLLYLKSGLLL